MKSKQGQSTAPQSVLGSIDDAEWQYLEDAAGLALDEVARKRLVGALDVYVRARTRDRSGGFVRVAKSSVRRQLNKVDTCVVKLQKLYERFEAGGHLLTANVTTHWAARCENYERPKGVLDLKPYDYLQHFLWLVEDQGKDLRKLQMQCLKSHTALNQAIQYTDDLKGLLTLSDGAAPTLFAGPINTALVIKGAGVDKVRDAAIALIWYHLQTALRKRRVGHDNFPDVLRLINDAVRLSEAETYGGKRSTQRDFLRESLIDLCAMAFESAGGRVTLYYSGDRDLNTQTTGFIPLLCEVNRWLDELGCAPANGDPAIAQAAQNLFKRVKGEPVLKFPFCGVTFSIADDASYDGSPPQLGH